MTSSENSHTEPSGATEEAEAEEANAEHVAGRGPTPDEEAAAPDHVEPGVAESYADMAERGAHVKGEGELP